MFANSNRQSSSEPTNSRQSQSDQTSQSNLVTPPAITLPKGGGAIRGMGEKFAANPVTGTGSMSVPIATSPGRGGFGPQLVLSYDSGAGNGLFGFGWNLSLPAITRWYGKSAESRIADPTDPTRIFSWLICESYREYAVPEYFHEVSYLNQLKLYSSVRIIVS